MARTTRLELATSAVIDCTQIRGFSVLGVELLFGGANGVVPVSGEHGWNHETQNAFQALTKDDIMIS